MRSHAKHGNEVVLDGLDEYLHYGTPCQHQQGNFKAYASGYSRRMKFAVTRTPLVRQRIGDAKTVSVGLSKQAAMLTTTIRAGRDCLP